MDTHIKFEGNVTDDDSYHLGELANLLQEECDLSVMLEKVDSKAGVKDGGLTIGLTVVGLVFSAIGTLVSVLAYWKSRQPKYSITITVGNKTLSIENISPEQLQDAVARLKSAPPSSQIEVKISR